MDTNMQDPPLSSLFQLTADLTGKLESSDIAYELISSGFGISADGIERVIEQLKQAMPNLVVTNGHILAVLMGELISQAALDPLSVGGAKVVGEEPSMQQKIEHIALTYYTGSLWDLLESLAFCLRMVEIAHMNRIKKESYRVTKEFYQQIVNAVRPACKLAAAGYPEAIQMVFRRFAELGVQAEEAVDLTLEEDRSSRLSPFTIERSLPEGE